MGAKAHELFWRVEECAPHDLQSVLNKLDADGFEVHSIHVTEPFRVTVVTRNRVSIRARMDAPLSRFGGI